MAEEPTPPPAEEAHETQTKMTEESSEKKKEAMTSNYKYYDIRRSVCTFIVVFLLLAGVTSLIVWLIYRPHKPHFTVVGAAIYELNTTSPPVMSTTMQFTIVTRNPNKRVSIYYDRLSAYVSYRNQAITPPVMLPNLFHEKKSTVALSPILGGGGVAVPVSMEVVNGLVMDEAYGVVGLRLVLMGRLRWKAGAIKTGKYGVVVKCDMLVGFKKGFLGQVPLLGSPECDVDI
ncbi:Late embryogenesis abundant protein [Macleaya cordata]|uniref:Late embryogenesis abundant protein n=1 Tax=Macleaya cordata TaxID=56857 RepID=A0A200Q2K6_MACCD|nr:Late embryogenesis abundant protein [Macleaya cordata]